MNRKQFLLSATTLLPFTTTAMKLNYLHQLSATLPSSEQMPVLFLGHGSPMNAIEENEFVAGFRTIARKIPTPTAIICISAHWETRGTFVTAMEMPKTIHDFGGFPKALFDVQYPAKGSPLLANEIKEMITETVIELDDKWGLDHGAWSVIKHLYPTAQIPVVQFSLDYTKTPQYHYDLAKQLAALRRKGVLIIGSGNMVHNLRMMAWDKMNVDGFAFDWATEASQQMKSFILDGNHQKLVDFKLQGKAWDLAIPSPEHYLPLLYTLALKEKSDTVHLFNDKPVAGSLTMTSVMLSKG